jgi:hypothetical protein
LLENTQCGILKKEIVAFFIVMTEMFAFVRDVSLCREEIPFSVALEQRDLLMP